LREKARMRGNLVFTLTSFLSQYKGEELEVLDRLIVTQMKISTK
jgi:hypothetical protein